jgi:hypothetical protein
MRSQGSIKHIKHSLFSHQFNCQTPKAVVGNSCQTSFGTKQQLSACDALFGARTADLSLHQQ